MKRKSVAEAEQSPQRGRPDQLLHAAQSPLISIVVLEGLKPLAVVQAFN